MVKAVAVLLAVIVTAGCVNPFSSEPEPTARELFEGVIAAGGPPLVVPRSLPEGYGMLWANQYVTYEDGLPGIEVCIAPSKRMIVGSCVGTEDASPWQMFKLDGNIVIISTLSAPEEAELLQPWLDLDWTTDWENLDWIDQTFTEQGGG